MVGDVLSIESDVQSGAPLVECMMKNGERVTKAPSLDEIRERASRSLAQLPEALRGLDKAPEYPVEVAGALNDLVDEVDRRHHRLEKELRP